MGSAVMKVLRFPDAQELLFREWKRSYIGSVVLLGGRFADVQDFRFETAKRSD